MQGLINISKSCQEMGEAGRKRQRDRQTHTHREPKCQNTGQVPKWNNFKWKIWEMRSCRECGSERRMQG